MTTDPRELKFFVESLTESVRSWTRVFTSVAEEFRAGGSVDRGNHYRSSVYSDGIPRARAGNAWICG